jgi:hypothetical protein
MHSKYEYEIDEDANDERAMASNSQIVADLTTGLR